MHEQEKLSEAKHFLQRMEASLDDPTAFLYALSAFLSAARSVLQYAYEEARTKTSGKQWYEAHVSGNPVLKFFKDKRDINIHTEPIRPLGEITVSLTEGMTYPTQANSQEGGSGTRIRYVFRDWRGSEDIIDLSHQYVEAIEIFVKAGLSNGVISG